MKYIVFPLYFYSLLPILFGVGLFASMQGSDSFILAFFSALACIAGMNISGIMFYKSCNFKNEIYKYIFSSLHILGLAFLIITLQIL